MERLIKLCAGPLMALACCSTFAAASEIGAIVMHGKWGNPGGNMTELVHVLEREGLLVSAPEMPWSGTRLYDKTVEGVDAEIDAEIAKLRERGAKQIFVIGQSLGAAFALHYVTRAAVTGIIAIAPGHRAESPVFAKMFGSDLSKARELAAAGKGEETISFTDLNTGNRRSTLQVSANSFLSYFDPAGPLNMARNAETVKPEVPVLWLVPTREEQPARNAVVAIYSKLPKNPRTRFAEPEADHLSAPGASTQIVIDWIREIAAKK